MKKITLSILALAATAFMAAAQAPAAFNYQGIARNSAGAPIASKALGMRITIHDGSPSGATVFQETQNATTNAYGLYNVTIGSGVAISGTLAGVNFGNGQKYLQIEIDVNGGTAYADLGASQLLSVPYALHAASATAPTLTLTGNSLTAGGNSVTLPGASLSGTANYLPKFTSATALGNSALYQTTAGKIGFGTLLPEAKMQIDNTADSTALYVTSTYSGTNNVAMVVENLSTTTSTTNTPSGLTGYSIPSLSSATGKGVIGYGGNVGIYGFGQSSTTSSSSAVFGSYGVAYSNADALGSYGLATNYSGTGGTKYGVYGVAVNGTVNYAGYFSGNVAVTGFLSKAGGTFKIDHPLDPDNKYLYHSFVESPDMMNIYNGNITTDAQGFATVTMPSYFDALNKDYRYQLTVIGTFAQAIVKEKMSGNTFRIQTNVPNVEVSWQVTGVRQDAYANAHRVQVEVDKEAQNKGRYLHPEELGKPLTSEINYGLNHPKEAPKGKEAIKAAARQAIHQ